MSDLNPITADPEARAIIFIFRDKDESSADELEQKLEECRKHALTRGLTVVEEVVTQTDDMVKIRERGVAAIEQLRAKQFIVGRVAPSVLRSAKWSFIVDTMHWWMKRGARIYVPEGEGIDLLELLIETLDRGDLLRVGSGARRKGGRLGRSPASPAPSRVPAVACEVPKGYDRAAPSLGSLSGVPPTPVIPLRTSRGEPLPHDGLFIRRNNAFGTRSTVGIKDLIEEGVLIDQSQIRFDDFVAANVGDVPAPGPGDAIAVSHGVAPIAGKYKAHEATTHFLEIALRAAQTPPAEAPHRGSLPVNFVFVVDTSGSMDGEKLDTVKKAIHQLHAQLRDTDVLGIVSFDTQVRTVLKATPKRELSPESLVNLVMGLHATGGTDINLGLLYGIDELSRHSYGRADLVNCIYLFSDGDPTSGETDWLKIRANVASRIRGDVKLSCFGFGSDARTRELDALAGLTGGHSTFVIRPEDVRMNLAEDLSRREHLAAINLQLQVEIDADVTIWHLYGHDLITDPAMRATVEQEARAAARRGRDEIGVESLPDLITQDKGIRVFAPDLAFGETYWLVFELAVRPGSAPPSFGTATVQYVDCVARASRRQELALSSAGAIPAATTLVHGVGLWTSETTFYALDDLYQNDRETAKHRLSNHVQTLQAAYADVPVTQFRDDQVTLRKLISLTDNLGRAISWAEDTGQGRVGYAMYAMNGLGQVRSGFVRARPGTL
jgi:Mg-chelatase subunit ChlD